MIEADSYDGSSISSFTSSERLHDVLIPDLGPSQVGYGFSLLAAPEVLEDRPPLRMLPNLDGPGYFFVSSHLPGTSITWLPSIEVLPE